MGRGADLGDEGEVAVELFPICRQGAVVDPAVLVDELLEHRLPAVVGVAGGRLEDAGV